MHLKSKEVGHTKLFFLFFLLHFVMKGALAEDPVEDSYYCSIMPYLSTRYSCPYCECCDKPWIQRDFNGLKEDLHATLFGQHIAEYTITKLLSRFLSNPRPEKALAMSFNGLTGSGKTFVSRLIAQRLYKKGVDSKYVHVYVANRDFPHEAKVSQYQDRLHEEIMRFTKACGQSLFIFEEVEKMPSGTIDAIKPYLDHHEKIDGVDYRRNIFIFLSNSGSQGITEKTLEFWSQGKDREDLCLDDIDELINKGSFNEKGGFQYSEILSSALIDVFVPFLPLEKKHVIKCIEAEAKKRNAHLSPDRKEKLLNSLLYFPEGTDLFSSTGCKRIPNKIDLYLN